MPMSLWIKRLRWLFTAICDFLIPSRRKSQQCPAVASESPDGRDIEGVDVATEEPEESESSDKASESGEGETPVPIQPPQPDLPVRPTPETKKQVPPPNRGGRPLGPGPSGRKGPQGVERKRKPELVCWRQGMNWAVGIEVPDELADKNWCVRQASSDLIETSNPLGRWPLTSPLGIVEAKCDGEGEPCQFPSEPFRIFKLSGPSRSEGRYMQSVTRGRFLIVTPQDGEVVSKSVIQAPEYIIGGDYRAYLVEVTHQNRADAILIRNAGGSQNIPMDDSAFELQGDVIQDAHPGAGTLFRGEPPRLQCLRGTNYGTAVVLQVGPREQMAGWRAFASDFEELRPKIAARRAGWFSVRIYNESDRHIETLDFRFSSRLQGIEIETTGPMPGLDGHRSALVHILHGAAAEVVPLAGSANGELPVRKTNAGSNIEIPPSPSYDGTNWLIKESDASGVEVHLCVERIWWSLVDEDAVPSESRWEDRPLELLRADVAATSRRVLWVRLPPSCRGKDIRVGVRLQESLSLRPVAGNPSKMILPCRNLGRFAEFGQHAVDPEFKLWIGSEGGGASEYLECLVAKIAKRVEPIPYPALRLEALDPVAVMRMLTTVRRRYPRYRKEIDDFRYSYYRPLRRRPGRRKRMRNGVRRVAFAQEALNLLGLFVEEAARLGLRPRVPTRWLRLAELAQAVRTGTVEVSGTGGARTALRSDMYSHSGAV